LAFLAQILTTAFLAIEILGALYLGSIAGKPGASDLVTEYVEAGEAKTAPGLASLFGLLITLGNSKSMRSTSRSSCCQHPFRYARPAVQRLSSVMAL
jgi:threonine/homoserine/homoserine lactone efflux protein